MLESLVAHDGRTIRLSAIVNEMDEHLFLDLVEQARRALGELPSGFSGRVTGQVLQLVNAQQTLVSSQLRSLAFALLVVFLVIVVGLRSAKLTALSVLPNVVPLFAAFALTTSAFVPMRYFGLLSGTAMLIALAADLWLVPAMFVLISREEGS